MKLSTLGVFATTIGLVLPAPAFADFPVPRAEAEFRELIPFLVGWGEKNKGDETLFRRWVMPYGPLDLQVTHGTHDEAEALRNFYFGFAAKAFGIDPRPLPNEFHCGRDCVESRRADLETKLPQLTTMVGDFRRLKGVDILAIWGLGDDFRINNLFRIMGEQRETTPSKTMGFVPSGKWTAVKDPDEYIAAFGSNPVAVHAVVQQMRNLSIAAIVHEPGGSIRVVRIGVSDNESGLLFTEGAAPSYTLGEKLPDGRQIVFVLRLAPDVLFYESS
ncbi:MAG TPA: hypothetical protein VMW19_22580 [Myxococcota bacterium]|nr:hypothetical protein [Myxococcota bacterium]